MQIRFAFDLPVYATMDFELEYPAGLQLDPDEKREVLSDCTIKIWMYVDGVLVGETYGHPMKHGFKGFKPDPMAVYCYSNTILRPWQGKGFGRILKATFIGVASRRYDRIYGHARPGGSQRLNKSFGAVLGKSWTNWYKTGETYRQYVLKLA